MWRRVVEAIAVLVLLVIPVGGRLFGRQGAHSGNGLRALLGQLARSHKPTTIDDVAIGLISGRSQYWSSLQTSVLQYAPRGMLLEAPGKCDCNFVAAFKALSVAEPAARWYYVGDEDAFLYLDHLVELISAHDHKKPILMATLGNHPGSYESVCYGQKSPIPDTRMEGTKGHLTFFGGTGIIVSAALLQQVDWEQPCGHNARAADRDVTCLIGRSWTADFQFVKLDGLKNEDEANASLSTLDLARHHGIFHHLSVENISKKASLHAHLKGNFTMRTVPLWKNHGCGAPVA